MLAIVAKTIARFKLTWGQELEDEAILVAMREAGHTWRDRELNPVTTVRLFLMQILFGNVACDFVPRLAGKSVSGSAYCQARGRLPLEALQTLLTRCTSAMSAAVRDTGLWLGHRLFVMDGSSFSMPDTDELRNHFGQSGGQRAGCGFPTAFPVDVWVMKALRQHYFRNRRTNLARLREFSATHFGPQGGYAQQYLFHWLRLSAGKKLSR